MKNGKLGLIQIIIGIISIFFWVINFIATGALLNRWYIGTDNSILILFGIFAIITGKKNFIYKK